jgi:hypothetical protein
MPTICRCQLNLTRRTIIKQTNLHIKNFGGEFAISNTEDKATVNKSFYINGIYDFFRGWKNLLSKL